MALDSWNFGHLDNRSTIRTVSYDYDGERHVSLDRVVPF